jgi:starvation-inducible outer membrane lipoprotein
MKKIIASLLIILSSFLITGCNTSCEVLQGDECNANNSCVAHYKPCNASDEGCKDNRLFTECVTKTVKTK